MRSNHVANEVFLQGKYGLQKQLNLTLLSSISILSEVMFYLETWDRFWQLFAFHKFILVFLYFSTFRFERKCDTCLIWWFARPEKEIWTRLSGPSFGFSTIFLLFHGKTNSNFWNSAWHFYVPKSEHRAEHFRFFIRLLKILEIGPCGSWLNQCTKIVIYRKKNQNFKKNWLRIVFSAIRFV